MAEIKSFRLDETPDTEKWKLLTLYKENLIGNTSFWEIQFDGDNHLSITHGTVDGAPTTAPVEIKMNTSGRSVQEQALLEARGRYRIKFREGYRPHGSLPSEDKDPMLANEWVSKKVKDETKEKGTKVKANWKTIDKFPVACQAKLDGIRMLTKATITGVDIRSRTNKPFPHFNQIKTEMKTFFEYLPHNSELDGELYTHDVDFNTIASIVRTEKKAHKDIEKIKYYIFDVILPDNPPYEERYNILLHAYEKYMEDGNENIYFYLVSSTLCYDDEEILEAHNQFVEMGYEGVMVRKLAGENPTPKDIEASRYKFGRGSNLLKYKEFTDEEAEVIGVEEATGTEAGTAILKIKDIRNNEFLVRMRGSLAERKKWLDDPSLVLKKKVTFRYQELSPYGVPRFPVGIAVRDYE